MARRASGWQAESSGSAGGGGDPLHDVHLRLTGPAADDLLRVFIGRWYANGVHNLLDRTKGPLLGLCQPRSVPQGSALVRVEQTFNATFAPPVSPVQNCNTPPPNGPVAVVRARGVEPLYLTAISNARRFIYWEDQYMVHMCAAEALRRALRNVELIILLMADSQISDLPHKWAWRKRFVEHIRRDPQGHKLHVFVLRDAATGRIGAHIRSRQDNHGGRRTLDHRLGQLQPPRLGSPTQRSRPRSQVTWAPAASHSPGESGSVFGRSISA